ncbi:MAG: NPCBM/NEW2 domain-containing protein [Bacteroidota bacterium]|nr:NPCBM/NEW2 domain-containing protein [Bacteroidota bacterium]
MEGNKTQQLMTVILMVLVLMAGSCKEEKIATGPEYTYTEWPYSVPARISDEDNNELFLMALGNVKTSLADGVFDPVKDEIILNDGTVIPHWYRDSLGLKYYNPIDKEIFPLPPSGFCTWYYYYQHINEEEVKLNAKWMGENLVDYGATYVQIDDGWQEERADGGHGSRDWTGIDQAFPSGMSELAEYIKGQGLIPGIWIAPHGQSNDSVVMANPGVFILKPDSTSASSTWEGNWLVDPTSEAAHKYLYDLFAMMVNWGYDYYKIDGQPIVVREYERVNEFMKSPGQDNEKLYRETLETIRKAIGPERYLLGCWGIPTEGMGIMNGSRTGGDVVLGWSGFDVALMPTMRYYYQHNIAWYTDPDVMMLRRPLTLQQAQMWATLQGLTGQALMTSDRLTDLSEERVELLKKVYPAVDIRPVDLFPSNKRKTVWDLRINHLGRQYDVVGLFNFGEKELQQKVLNFDDIGLENDSIYHVFDFWNNEYLGAWEKGMAFEIPPTSCRVITIMPDNGEIQLVSTNRHITQGWVDLEEIKYNGREKIYKGKSNVIKNDPYQIHFAYPRGEYYKVSNVRVKGTGNIETKINNHQGWSTVTIHSPRTTEIKWTVTFEPAYSYKYMTRDPGRLSAEALGVNAVKLSWQPQYYLNSGYQVYLDDELLGYTPATYFTIEGLDPEKEYTADVRTVWKDGEINKRPPGDEQEHGIKIRLKLLVPDVVKLTDIKASYGEPRFTWKAEMNDKTYATSISAFADSRIAYDINGIFNEFTATIGVDIKSRTGDNNEGMVLTVEGDGQELYRSRNRKISDKPVNISVDISGIRELVLRTEGTGDSLRRRRGLMGNWADPLLKKQ